MDRLETLRDCPGDPGGKRWRQQWERTYRGGGGINLTELNAFKDRITAPLSDLQEAFRKENLTVRDMIDGVKELLEAYHAEERLEEFAEDFTREKEYRLAGEYSQVYELVMELLERLSRSFRRGKCRQKRIYGNTGCRLSGNYGGVIGNCGSGSGRRYYQNQTGSH